jgi:hypothetical protein
MERAEASMADPSTRGELIQTEDDTRADDAILAPDVVTLDRAVRALHHIFGPLVDDDYLPGKTELRDALAAGFGLSILTAEELCDELERAGRIRFVRTEEGTAWHIHDELVPT